jgi:general secretion pathway protein F
MTVWQYTAFDAHSCASRSGELSAETDADARAQLRRAGLQVVRLRAMRMRRRDEPASSGVATAVRDVLARHTRRRRLDQRAEFFDGLSTLMASGVPLLEALETLGQAGGRQQRASRTMLAGLRESVRSGDTLAGAMRQHPGWFGPTEIAMVDAGQAGGHLSDVLARLAEEQASSSALYAKLVGTLMYPAVVTCVGIGVMVFLSVRTLPELTTILIDAEVPVPGITSVVMSIGQWISSWWWLVVLVGLAACGVVLFFPAVLVRCGVQWTFPRPLVLRRLAVGRFSMQLAELLRSGVPAVDGLRVLGPTTGARPLRDLIAGAARRIEEGETLSDVFDNPRWFDAEYRQLIGVGEASGELPALLDRIGGRYERTVQRQIERLAGILEPVTILALAAGVGVVVMAAVLPLLRMQEIVA